MSAQFEKIKNDFRHLNEVIDQLEEQPFEILPYYRIANHLFWLQEIVISKPYKNQ